MVQIEHHADRIEDKESLLQTDDLSFSVSSPKYISKEQVHYLSGYLNNVEKQLKNNEPTEIDVDSFVKYYLLHEVFANSEDSSCFLCKDTNSIDRKLYACSVWDADLCIGNSWLTTDVNPAVLYCNRGNWINYLYDNQEFRSLLTDYYISFFKSDIQRYPSKKSSMVLVVNSSDTESDKQILDTVKKYSKYCQVKSKNHTETTLDMVIEIKVDEESNLIHEIMKIDGVTSASVLSHDGEITV